MPINYEYANYTYQRCFVGHTQAAEWREDLLATCREMLPAFGLEPWYAEDHFDPSQTLRQKVVQAIANARYGIYDLSFWRKDEHSPWQMPHNVLIELGMAIALNRPALLLRHSSNRELPLPRGLRAVELLEFSGGHTLRRKLKEQLPKWIGTPPEQDWWSRLCHFGGRVCTYREAHPRAQQWGQARLRCFVADGLDAEHPAFRPAERYEARGAIEAILRRYGDLDFEYLDELMPAKGYLFTLCGRCQAARANPLAIYRITPQTPADVFITLGISIALETQFGYDIPKVLLAHKQEDLPSLLRGYEVIEAASSSEIERKLRASLPAVNDKVRATAWQPRSLPFADPAPTPAGGLRMPADLGPYQPGGYDLLRPGELLRGQRGEYRVLGLIGRGGKGAVYRVERQRDRAILALKDLSLTPDVPQNEINEMRQLFIQTAEQLAALNHPGLQTVIDLFGHAGRPAVVLEFIDGRTLEERVWKASAPFLQAEALGYGAQIARILEYLHTHQPPIIYRDVKPSNFMLRPDGAIKLIDFNPVWVFKPRKSKDTIAMGSAGYAPPEQYGKGYADARSDIYGLGATLLHLLTKMPPIPLQTPAPGSIRKVNPSVDEQIEQMIIKAMQIDPNLRYQSMSEFEQAILLHSLMAAPTTQSVPRLAEAGDTKVGYLGPLPSHVAQKLARPAGPECVNCGYVNKPSARFCARCGSRITARLLISSPRARWEHPLDRLPLQIGRRDPRQNHYPDLDLNDHDRGIASRKHALIERDAEHFYTLTDLGAVNGTSLNGAMIPQHQPQRLHSGDYLRIGEVEIEFRWG